MVVELAFVGLDMGADPGDAARSFTCQGGGGYSPGTSLVMGIGRRVYAIFTALTALVVLADLGDVAVASC